MEMVLNMHAFPIISHVIQRVIVELRLIEASRGRTWVPSLSDPAAKQPYKPYPYPMRRPRVPVITKITFW
jgi:hypothetical protein